MLPHRSMTNRKGCVQADRQTCAEFVVRLLLSIHFSESPCAILITRFEISIEDCDDQEKVAEHTDFWSLAIKMLGCKWCD